RRGSAEIPGSGRGRPELARRGHCAWQLALVLILRVIVHLAWAVVQERAREWHPWIRPVAVETPGFVYNITYMARSPQLWKSYLYGSGTVAEWAAGVPMKPYFPERAAAEDNKLVGVMAVTANIFVTLDPNIKTSADFKGKRVGVGLR